LERDFVRRRVDKPVKDSILVVFFVQENEQDMKGSLSIAAQFFYYRSWYFSGRGVVALALKG
jgi:hypothetical protein